MTQHLPQRTRIRHALCAALLIVVSQHAAHASTFAVGKTQYDAHALRMENLRADINIRVAAQDGITVNYNGPQELADLLDMEIANNTLTIGQRKRAPIRAGNVSVVTIGTGINKNVVTINGETTVTEGDGIVVVNGQTAHARPQLDIVVPPGTPLILTRFKGKANIGDVRGPLTLDTSGDVHVDSVAETLDLEVTGNGDVRIAAGEVRILNARVSKNGKIRFDGHALEANLTATGNGDLSVAHIEHQPRVRVSRNGDISVGNW